MRFAHVLGINAPARERFSVGPVDRPAGDDSSVRAVFDPGAWDRSRAIVAPGQADSPDSPHVADLAPTWARGEMLPLAFSEAAVQANMESTLTLISTRGRNLPPRAKCPLMLSGQAST